MLFYTEPKIFALQKLQCVFVYLCIFRSVTTQNVRNLHSDTSWCTFARLTVGTNCVLCMIFAGICTVRFNTRYSILPPPPTHTHTRTRTRARAHTVYSCVCVCRMILTRQNHYFPLQHPLDVRGSVHHSTIHKEKSKKMQHCIRILLFHINMKLNTFRATHHLSSGA
jgi:hypothetical protein